MNDRWGCRRRRHRWPWGAQRGSGTVLVTALAAAAVFGLVAVLALTAAASAAARAARASDLAALAAADAARGLTRGDPCRVAADIAAHNAAQLVQCRQSGPGGVIVDVWTAVDAGPGTAWLALLGAKATGRARAGPPVADWMPPG